MRIPDWLAKWGLMRAVVFIALILVLIIDFLFWESSEPVALSVADGGLMARPFHARFEFSKFELDKENRRFKANLKIIITGNSDQKEIKHIAYWFQEKADGSAEIKHSYEDRGDFRLQWVAEEGQPDVLEAAIQTEVVIEFEAKREEVFYPFDQMAFKLAVGGCANCSGDPLGTENLVAEKLKLDFSEPGFLLYPTPDGSKNLFIVERRPFLRILTVIFFITSSLFLFHLLRISTPKDLLVNALGLFAALWGFRNVVVPENLHVFPSMIDYFVLTLFSFAFVVILINLPAGRNSMGEDSQNETV